MSRRRLVDTNLIVRYLVHDHDRHSKAAAKLFHACDRGDLVIVLLTAVLAESVFVCSLSTSIHVEISHRRSADSSPALALKSAVRRFTSMPWIVIEERDPFRGLPDRRDCCS